jgi:hypothetical protein
MPSTVQQQLVRLLFRPAPNMKDADDARSHERVCVHEEWLRAHARLMRAMAQQFTTAAGCIDLQTEKEVVRLFVMLEEFGVEFELIIDRLITAAAELEYLDPAGRVNRTLLALSPMDSVFEDHGRKDGRGPAA